MKKYLQLSLTIKGNQKDFKIFCETKKGNTNIPSLQEGENKLLILI